ncbi:MAG: hypothetical protein H0U27_04020, partial [Nitrosopumilus sp.]|nr:hypothetical protein [Nitrosopumilus sp.]
AKGITRQYVPYEIFTSKAFSDKKSEFDNSEKDQENKILDEMDTILKSTMSRMGQYASGVSLYEMITGESFGEGDLSSYVKPFPIDDPNQFFEITNKEGLRSKMEEKLQIAGTKDGDRKTILDLIFPSEG